MSIEHRGNCASRRTDPHGRQYDCDCPMRGVIRTPKERCPKCGATPGEQDSGCHCSCHLPSKPLVQALRDMAADAQFVGYRSPRQQVLLDAADEIERLRAALKDICDDSRFFSGTPNPVTVLRRIAREALGAADETTTRLPKLEYSEHCGCCIRNKITMAVFAPADKTTV